MAKHNIKAATIVEQSGEFKCIEYSAFAEYLEASQQDNLDCITHSKIQVEG